MRRATLGIIALLLLIVGGVTAFSGPGGSDAWNFSGVCIKSGLVLGALWLALPQLQAALVHLPRRLIGWFVGKFKRKENPTLNSQPGPPQRRPRRRSNT
jgi:hypothetical protein